MAPVYTYTVTDIGGLGGQSRYGEMSLADRVNARGQVTGYTGPEYYVIRAFLYDLVAGMIDLNRLPEPPAPDLSIYKAALQP
jgi:hypothetical protein